MLTIVPHHTVHVHPEHEGLPGLALGGYVAGLLAATAGGDAEVKLRRPVPIPATLTVDPAGERGLELRDGDTLYAHGARTSLELAVPEAPSLQEAIEAAHRFPGHHDHPFPHCYACGPERAPGAGLRVFPGPVAGRPLVAAPWTPPSEADGIPFTAVEDIWAAFDCVELWALIVHADGRPGDRVVTAKLAGRTHAPVSAGEQHIVYGWPAGRTDSAYLAGAALVGPDGELKATGLQTAVTAEWGVPLKP